MFTSLRRAPLGALGRVSTVAVSLALIAGCSGGPSAVPATSTSAPPTTVATEPAETTAPATPAGDPTGVIALGHSGINGEGNASGVEVSWATGSSTSVNSVYLRLVDVVPETEGHVANAGVSGSRASALGGQAMTALQTVPNPRLVLIYTLDNDIQCADDESPHVAAFGMTMQTALEQIAGAAPETTILVTSAFGRPARWAAMFADKPEIREQLGGGGACDMFDPSGTLVPAKVDRITAAIELYEAEIARVCATVPQCHTDEGAFTTYQDALDDYAPDYGHLNARGHAKLAELIWPRVVEVLGLG